jgi:ADP-ribosylglycohydrolase
LTPDQRAAGLFGLLVGDALGVPYEFHDPRNLPPPDAIELEPPAGFRRSHAGVPIGTWSDDGAHALCLLSSLVEQGELDLDDLGERLVRWWHRGLWCVDDRPFDIGNQTTAALLALEAGPYEVAVRRAISFGLDTDTTACVTGGIAGLRDGLDAIPKRWLFALRGRDRVDALLARM